MKGILTGGCILGVDRFFGCFDGIAGLPICLYGY